MSALLPASAAPRDAQASAPRVSRHERSPRPAVPRTALSGRDPVIDLVRVVCVCVVVALHLLVASIESSPTGGVVIGTPIQDQAWFGPLTWVIQVMPLFFVVGGFASMRLWQRMQARGATAADFAGERIGRLLVPGLLMFAGVGVFLGAAALAGTPAQLVADGSYWIGRPLWFLGVYLVVSALVPLMAAAHRRSPRLTLGILVLTVIAVDLARGPLGDGVTLWNYVFVWLTLQQFGFFLADGTIHRIRPRTAVVALVGAVATLIALTGFLGYAPDLLLAGNNPATVALVVLGVGQVAVLRLVYGRLVRVAERPRVAAVVARLNACSTAIYLWHMTALAVVVAVMIVFAVPLPTTFSPAWWVTRPVVLAVIALVLVPFVVLARAAERRIRLERRTVPAARIALAVVLGVGAVVVILQLGFAPVWAPLLALALGTAALAGAGYRLSPPAPRTDPAPRRSARPSAALAGMATGLRFRLAARL